MPQMSPMWWTTLMMVFIASFLMCMYMMYFTFNKKVFKKTTIKKNNLNWMW